MSFDPTRIKGYELLDEIAAKALDDVDYRRRLLDEPKAVLREAGLVIGDDVEVVIHRNRPKVIHLVLPSAPPDRDRLNVDEVDVMILGRHHTF
jgi:Nitrile hydratase, alpha chain